SPDRCHRQILLSRGCERGVSIPRHQDLAILRSLSSKSKVKGGQNMNMPGFSAEASLYETSGRYRMASTGVLAAPILSQAVLPQQQFCCVDGYCSECLLRVNVPQMADIIEYVLDARAAGYTQAAQRRP